MSTIFKTRISQQEVQTPVVSADTVVTDNFITSSIQSESVSSEEVLADLVSAVTIESDEVFATDTNTTNLVVTNDFSPGGDVIVSSGNVLVSKGGTVSFLDDGEIVEEDGATGFPVFSGIPEILNNGTIYNIGEIDKDVDLSGIHFSGNDKMVQTCEIWFSIGDEAHDIYWPENLLWLDSTDGNAPAIVVRTEYRIAIRKEANGSMVASIAYALGEGSEIVSGNMMEGVARLDADNTFTAGNTFTGAVDMSTAQVTPPEGWNVSDLTPEAIQQVVPIKWDETSVIFGVRAGGYSYATCLGVNAHTVNYGVAVGANVTVNDMSVGLGNNISIVNPNWYSIGIGNKVAIKAPTTITIGTVVDDSSGSYTCSTEGTGSITIGAGANTKNNGSTESSNSVTIGCKALNHGADSVVIGARANTQYAANVVIGANAKGIGNEGVAIGNNAETVNKNSTAVGASSRATSILATAFGALAHSGDAGVACGAKANAETAGSTAIGVSANAKTRYATAIGADCIVNDYGATVIRSTAEDGTYTQLYFSGANTPLANTYHGGAPMLGYVTKDSAGNIVAAGTRSLIDLLTDNSTFAPASLDENGEWVAPKVFHPSDLDLPQEEPTEPEEYQPLPVYPIVEPEIEEI